MSKNEDDIAWCLNNGATSTQWNTAWMQALIANGATEGALPDMKAQVFEDVFGYSGSLSDMEKQWIEEGRPDAVSFDYNGTVLISYNSAPFVGCITEGDFTPSDSCGLPLLPSARWNSLLTYPGVVSIATSGNEALYSSVELTLPDYSETPITLTLSGSKWAGNDAGVIAWMATQVGNTIGFQVTGTPA